MTGSVPVSVKRLIVEIDPGSVNVSEFCRTHGVSRWLFYDVRRRYAVEGDTVFELKSRAANTVANKTPMVVEDKIVELRKQLDDTGLDSGPASILVRLVEAGVEPVPSESTIWRILTARGFVQPEPKKRPRPATRRFARERGNELWQIDGTDWALADGTPVKIINIIDDASRYVTASQAHLSESFHAVWSTTCAGIAAVGAPEQMISDNAKAFEAMEPAVAALGIVKTNSRPGHPQTCGKVERFHQTLKKWLRAQPAASTLAELQAQLDKFRVVYNEERPHRSLGRRTPAAVFAHIAKSGPAHTSLAGESRVHYSQADRQGRVTAGKQIRINLGTAHAREHAVTIINHLTAHTFINGQHIRTIRLEPGRDNYPLRHAKV
jgi:transposase InsO family protein